MTTGASLRGSAYGMICDRCGNSLIAAECSEYFDEEQIILNLWSCIRCGNPFESEAFIPVDPKSKIDSKVLEKFFPSLLVA